MTEAGLSDQASAVESPRLDCSHLPACPGCPRFGEPGLAPETELRIAALAQRGGITARAVQDGPRVHFRHRARLAVRGRKENPKIGIFELGSHRVVHIPNCQIHHPLINEVARTVRRALVDHGILPYSELAHAGQVRYLQVVIERRSQSAQVVVVTAGTAPHGLEAFFTDIARKLGPRLHSLFWNGQPERSNSVLGPLWHKHTGPDTVCESFRGARLFFPPGAFGQSHLDLAERIAERVAEHVPEGAHIAEFYAGVGALGLPLVERSREVSFNELSEDSLSGLRQGIAALGPTLAGRVKVFSGSAASAREQLAGVDSVIVDPPRKGLEPELLDELLAHPPAQLVYVSCGLDALLREAEALLGSGKFRLTALEPFALFPYTDHVETLAVFTRT